jgi:hypothetical protein
MTEKEYLRAELTRAWQKAMIVRNWPKARELFKLIRKVRGGA